MQGVSLRRDVVYPNDEDPYLENGWIRNSNANHIFAAMILEEVTGQKIDDLIQKLVFNPRDLLNGIKKNAYLSTTTVYLFLRTELPLFDRWYSIINGGYSIA